MRELIEAIEAGAADEGHFARAFPSESAYGRCTWHDAIDAYRKNSVDAALALMAAIAPELRCYMNRDEDGKWDVGVGVDDESPWHEVWGRDNLGCALLLALLQFVVLRAKAGETP